VNGVYRGGYHSATLDNALLCVSAYRYREIRTYIAIGRGFRLNGVFRSGQYIGGDCRVGFYRCAWRGLRSDYYVPSRPIAYLGFRWGVKGVWRGGRRGSSYQNRVSIRNWQGDIPLSREHSDVGFRLNGVYRGGSATSAYGSNRFRSVYRYENRMDRMAEHIGFRLTVLCVLCKLLGAMRYEHFVVSADQARLMEDTERLNKFLSGHTINNVRSVFSEALKGWYYAVEYSDKEGVYIPDKATEQKGVRTTYVNSSESIKEKMAKKRRDFLKEMTDEEFAKMWILRECRKFIATEEGKRPMYIFLDKHFSEMIKQNNFTLEFMRTLEGIGDRATKYGQRLLKYYEVKVQQDLSDYIVRTQALRESEASDEIDRDGTEEMEEQELI